MVQNIFRASIVKKRKGSPMYVGILAWVLRVLNGLIHDLMYPIRFEDRYRWTNGPVWRCEEFTVRLVYSDTSVVLLFDCIMIQFHLPMKRLLFGSLLDFDRNYVRNDSSIVDRCHKVRQERESTCQSLHWRLLLMVRLHGMFWKEVLKRQ